MHLQKYSVVLIVFFTLFCQVNTARIYMDECNKNGFTCFSKNSSWLAVTLTCDDYYTEQNIEIHLYDFRAILEMSELIIQDCKSVTLNASCSQTITYLQRLSIVNVTTLYLLESRNQQNPKEILFQNIEFIPEIPHHFFVQSSKRVPNSCEFSNTELSNVTMKNVNVGVIRSGAFFNIRKVEEVKFSFCNILRVESKAIDVQLLPLGKFISRDSTFHDLDDNAIHVLGLKLFTADDDYTQVTSVDENTICFINLS